MFGVVFLAGYLFGTLSQTRNAMDNRNALQLFVFIVFGIYFVWFWAKGQTLAMKTWHIRVVDLLGKPLTQKRALLRYLYSWVWFWPPLALSWLIGLSGAAGGVLTLGWVVVYALLSRLHPERQFWHDAWAGTRLVTWTIPEDPNRNPGSAARKRQQKSEPVPEPSLSLRCRFGLSGRHIVCCTEMPQKPEQNAVMPKPAQLPLEASLPASVPASLPVSSQPASLKSLPTPAAPDVDQPVNPQKNRKGLDRIRHAAGYSLAGLRAGWHETAFRQEAIASIVLLPAAFWLGRTWVEAVLLAGTVVLIMIVELLNTGIEDRHRPDRPRMA